MKSEDIRKFVFINSSPNMFLISKHIKSFGYEVKYASTSEALNNISNKVYYFHNNQVTHYDLTVLEQPSDDNKTYYFRKTFLNNLNFKKYKNEFSNYLPGFEKGNFIDLQLLKKQRIKDVLPIDSERFNSIEELENKYNDYILISSYLPNSKFRDYSIEEKVFVIETDLDLKSCFADEYYIFLIEQHRIELFCIEGFLYIIANHKIIPLDILKKKFSFLSKFNFKIKKNYNVVRNRKPWILKNRNFILLNDYSFFNLSVKMADNWYESAGRFLSTGKL